MTAEEGTKPFVVACIPAYNEEGRVGWVVVRAMKHVDKVVVCDDGSVDLTGGARELGTPIQVMFESVII